MQAVRASCIAAVLYCEQGIDDDMEKSEHTIVSNLKLPIVSNDIESVRYGRHNERAGNLAYLEIDD